MTAQIKLTKKQRRNVERWLAALRSGEYGQGKDALCAIKKPGVADRFCCLGVACDLHKQWVGPPRPGISGLCMAVETGALGMPDEGWFEKTFGFRPNQAMFGPVGKRDGLADLNDAGVTFERIANYIEQALLS